MTPKQLNSLCKKLEMSRAEIAKSIKYSSKSVGNWQNGVYEIPVKAERRLLRLAKKLEAAPVVEEPEEQPPVLVEPKTIDWPIYLQAKGIKRLFEKYGESYAAFGRRLNTSGLTVRHWIVDGFVPSERFREPLRLLWAETFDSIPGTLSLRGKSTGLQQVLAPEPLLELSTEFYNEYRNIRNQQDVQAAISFAAKKANVETEVLRQAMAFVLLTLKKEMDTEAIYRCLTGHV